MSSYYPTGGGGGHQHQALPPSHHSQQRVMPLQHSEQVNALHNFKSLDLEGGPQAHNGHNHFSPSYHSYSVPEPIMVNAMAMSNGPGHTIEMTLTNTSGQSALRPTEAAHSVSSPQQHNHPLSQQIHMAATAFTGEGQPTQTNGHTSSAGVVVSPLQHNHPPPEMQSTVSAHLAPSLPPTAVSVGGIPFPSERPPDSEMKRVRRWRIFPGRNRFFCNGRVIMAKQISVFYFTLTLLTTTCVLFFIFDCPFLATKVSYFIPAVAGLLFVFVLCTLLRTSFTDPGIIPRATPEEAADVEVPNGRNSPTYRPPPRTKEVIINNQPIKLKYCFTCKIFRPPRASHCSLCDNCVDRFDHHCPWIGNCVGKRNYRFFYMFIVSLAFLCIYVFACIITHLILLSKDSSMTEAIKESPVSMVEAIICFFSVWSILGLAGFHTYLILSNLTTNEDIKGSFSSKRSNSVANPYSAGSAFGNCYSILCSSQPPSLIKPRDYVFCDEQTIAMHGQNLDPLLAPPSLPRLSRTNFGAGGYPQQTQYPNIISSNTPISGGAGVPGLHHHASMDASTQHYPADYGNHGHTGAGPYYGQYGHAHSLEGQEQGKGNKAGHAHGHQQQHAHGHTHLQQGVCEMEHPASGQYESRGATPPCNRMPALQFRKDRHGNEVYYYATAPSSGGVAKEAISQVSPYFASVPKKMPPSGSPSEPSSSGIGHDYPPSSAYSTPLTSSGSKSASRLHQHRASTPAVISSGSSYASDSRSNRNQPNASSVRHKDYDCTQQRKVTEKTTTNEPGPFQT